eukprot:1012865-Rhodomonas_salina.4
MEGVSVGVISVVPSLLRCARVRVLSAKCRWYMPGAAICTRRRNAEVRRVRMSGHIGGGSVNQDGRGVRAGGGVLVPSVARSAVCNEVNRSNAEWDVSSGTRWAECVMSSAGVRAASASRNARGDGLCRERTIGASSAESVATAAEAAAVPAGIAFAAVRSSSPVSRAPANWAKAGRGGCIIPECPASMPGLRRRVAA